jgi:2-polyprenyl-3-methyl-5-hydroxy-6-metoxy-1,4-benzoquinol methylase
MSKILVHKPIHPEKLKGIGLDNFNAQVKIAEDTAQLFNKIDHSFPESRCWVCDSSEVIEGITVYNIEFLQCKNCSHVYQKYVIPDQIVYKFFESDEDINCHLPQEQFDYRTEYVSKPKIEQLMLSRKELGLSNDHGKWLDIGCGGGELLYQVKNKYHWDVVGLDINQPGIEMAKKHGIDAYKMDIFEFFAKIHRKQEAVIPFDVVSAIGYFDVVIDPRKHLELLKKMMKPDSLIMIDQPRFNSFTVDLIKIIPESALRYCNALDRSIFTDESLKKFLEDAGFELVLDWRFGLDFYTFMSIMTTKIPQLSDSKIMKFFIENYNDFQNIFDQKNYNDCLLYVARLL